MSKTKTDLKQSLLSLSFKCLLILIVKTCSCDLGTMDSILTPGTDQWKNWHEFVIIPEGQSMDCEQPLLVFLGINEKVM